jgi:hypothetical protein
MHLLRWFLESIKSPEWLIVCMVTVDEIINSIPDQQKIIVKELRLLIRNSVSDSEEKVRNGKIVYAIEGKNFMRINPFTGHIDLEFMCGARLTPRDLKGRGKKSLVKHMKITTKKDLNDVELKELIEEASKTVC